MTNQLITIYIAHRLKRALNRNVGRQLSAMSQSDKISLTNSIDSTILYLGLVIVSLLPWVFLGIEYIK